MSISLISRKVRLNAETTAFFMQRPWSFEAGQYSAIHYHQKNYYFSIASAPFAEELELNVQNSLSHPLTPEFANFLEQTDSFELTPPAGKAILTDEERPLLLVAGGSGFAPMKSIIETALQQNADREIILYWGVRGKAHFYYLDFIQSWQQHSHFHFNPVLSEEKDFNYRHGTVTATVLNDFTDLEPYDIYLAGPFAMSHAARPAFIMQGARKNNVYSDAFN